MMRLGNILGEVYVRMSAPVAGRASKSRYAEKEIGIQWRVERLEKHCGIPWATCVGDAALGQIRDAGGA